MPEVIMQYEMNEGKMIALKHTGELVRCVDCKHWRDEFGGFGRCVCEGVWDMLTGDLCEVEDIETCSDFYCGCGERRKDVSAENN